MPTPPDLAAIVRRAKPHKLVGALRSRPKSTLLDAGSVVPRRTDKVLLDTNIYILDLAGTLSPAAVAILNTATLHHCSVCLGEIAVGLAARDVRRPTWPAEMRACSATFASMMPNRIHTPDRDAWIEAGLLAGSIARVQHHSHQDRRKTLNDALIYLTARKAGLPVLTENRADFDHLQQAAPGGVVYYCL